MEEIFKIIEQWLDNGFIITRLGHSTQESPIHKVRNLVTFEHDYLGEINYEFYSNGFEAHSKLTEIMSEQTGFLIQQINP